MNKIFYGLYLTFVLLKAFNFINPVETAANDWLINNSEYQAVILNNDSIVQISNGLIERTFMKSPNLATVSIKNCKTGHEHIRSIRPEAYISINGFHISVGGVAGQKIHNYLDLKKATAYKSEPNSFVLKKIEHTEIQARIKWKKREAWISGNNPSWPPKGKSIAFHFQAHPDLINTLALEQEGNYKKIILLQDDFTKIDKKWKPKTSPQSTVNRFHNEGKAGEIMALSNHYAFAETALPKETNEIICEIFPGTDSSAAWGPGISLVNFSNSSKFYLRTGEKKICIYHGQKEYYHDYPVFNGSIFLKIIFSKKNMRYLYSIDESEWIELENLSNPFLTFPEQIKIGKTDWQGKESDHPEPGKPGRCQIRKLICFGKELIKNQRNNKLDYLQDIEVVVHYNIYDGIPLISKWLEIINHSDSTITIDSFAAEIIAYSEAESSVGNKKNWLPPLFTVETDYAFGGSMSQESCLEKSVFFEPDPLYETQVCYEKQTPSLLTCRPALGPKQKLKKNEKFNSFRVFSLYHDHYDRERQGLALRKMYRTIAPWVLENPLLAHARNSDENSVKTMIDQCSEVDFDMVILTFGSGFNIENTDTNYLKLMKSLADYAHDRGIALGGYSLLASRKIGKGQDVVSPENQTPVFGNSPCLGSSWGIQYFEKLYHFFNTTGFDILEHDGSYPGDVCISLNHPGHTGYEDSQWNQFSIIKKFYHWCRSEGIYLNVPDWYFLNGSNKTGMGYRETNWSLPREYQEIIERQNIYDGAWEKTPSMGWMFVPLTEYHGGGEQATIEPLKEHLPHYEQRLMNLFTAGVQACFRGPRLYDSDETKQTVKKWVSFYRKYQDILNSDIIHIKRPCGNDYDGIVHVNPNLENKAMAFFYNPTHEKISKKITIPLYYSGLKENCVMITSDLKNHPITLDRFYNIEIDVSIPPKGMDWFLFR